MAMKIKKVEEIERMNNNYYSFMQDQRYIEIVGKLAKAFKRAVDQRKHNVKEEAIQNELNAVTAEIRKDIGKFKSQKSNEINKEINRIETAFKNKKNTYDDPTTELLQRQEFDMKVKASNNSQLKRILEDEQRDLSEHQLNMMLVEFKQRGMKEEATRVNSVKTARSIGTEYEQDPNYQKLSTQLASLELLRERGNNTMLYYPTEDRPRTVSLNVLNRVVNEMAGTSLRNLEKQALEVENGVNTMENNVKSLAEWKREVSNAVFESEVDEFAENVVSGKDKYEPAKYDDADPRAIKGTEEYDLRDEFAYLEERYHEPNHPIYKDYMKNGYEVDGLVQYIDYLRSKHEKNLNHNSELAEKIQQVKAGHREEPNREKEEYEQAILDKIKEKEAETEAVAE